VFSLLSHEGTHRSFVTEKRKWKSSSRALRAPFDALATQHTPIQEACGLIDNRPPEVMMKNFESSIVATMNTMQEPWSELSERQLVELIASGDGEAFAVICRKYQQRLFRTALRITENVSDAEDVVQEALLKAYQKIATFRFASSLSTWLTQIVINCGLMELRRRKSRPWLSLDNANENGLSLMELVPDLTSDVEEVVCLKEQSQLLTARIARLPPKLRIVIEDYRMSERTMAELAQTHAITVDAAKSRLLRAKTRIKNSRPILNATQPSRQKRG
jgi:RNA polymerase sigma-70 factor (ECF subfamily)